jgi:predicted ABC-type transport system involved in lysophospholipase L1 biosynthesis ATPase subunit
VAYYPATLSGGEKQRVVIAMLASFAYQRFYATSVKEPSEVSQQPGR